MKPQIKFLSDEEIGRLHEHALKILQEIGMRLPHKEALELLEKAGAEITDDSVVKIPEHMVNTALKTVPKRKDVTLYGRDPKHDITFTGHNPSLTCMTMAVNVIDPYTREKRLATNDDLAALTRIADQLENIGVNGGLVTPQEVPGDYNDWYTWATTLKNTTKHITGGMFGARCVRDAAKMASVAVGGEDRFRERPFISGWVLTLPPFGIDTESLDALMEMSRWKIPAIISSGSILGTSSPVTIAGTVAQTHAEILACIVVSQLVNPGAPMIYTSFARGVDMKSGNISMACPEFGILKVAMSQMGRSLDLPIRMPALLRDAKVLDAQAGFETGMVGTVTGLAADLMDSMQLDMDLVVDFPDLVFCNECMAGIKRMAAEVEVNDNTLALETMKAVGPGGNFLAQTHTFQNFRKELWHPELLERRNWGLWEKDGSPDIFKVAEKKVLEMLEAEPVKLLSPEAEAEIDDIVIKAQS
ncbi:trimethylamine methyltransferase [Desulfonema ishimotonii]|uniref:Trimethylamine methyltransferase n=1 Tax=Desulfonema ishimotonii TaxID=45657 RepID=A0A401FQY6_9BACT|nr:trimethylamine methyltransferase family protein [Desulfonema ishimotonii]GBC59370.1 trimethylamine methyltransferase [Desulfonema ishimotonii]